jgi:hypothetical protein
MRYASKRNSRFVLPALAAAGLGAMLGVPAAHGDFIITVTQVNGPISATGAPTVGAGETDFVLTALNNGLNGTGTNLLAVDATIKSSNPLVIDTADDTDGDGNPDANVDGFPDQSLASGNGAGVTLPIPTFGIAYNSKIAGAVGNNPFLGTFVGIGKVATGSNALKSLAFADNSLSVTAVQQGSSIGTSNQTVYLSGATGSIDPAFTNGTVTSLRVVGAFASASFKGPAANVTAVPFANIVVPNGTTGTVTGALSGDIGAIQPFSISFGAVAPPPPTGPFIQLAATGLAGTSAIGSITMSGHNGSYVAQTVPVTGAAQVTGALSVAGFTPGDTEIYGLAVNTTNLSALIAALNTAVGSADAGATATAVPSALSSVLAGDQIAVTIPGTSFNPNIFSYDLTNGTSGSSITSITVVPEPTGIGALVLGGLGLLSRRKRRMA